MTSDASGARIGLPARPRVGRRELLAAREAFLADRLAATLLEAIPDLAVVLNDRRQVIAFNERTVEVVATGDPSRLIGLRPGDLLECVLALEGSDGCGSDPGCAECGGAQGILSCLETHRACSREYRLRSTRHADGGALEFDAHASHVGVDGRDLVLLVLRDISAEKRREVLERTFFHDTLNTLTALLAVASLLGSPTEPPEQHEEDREEVVRLAEQIAEEVTAHRHLLAAEAGALQVRLSVREVAEIVDEVVGAYRRHSLADGRVLVRGEAPAAALETDVALLRRVLGNLVKNALEATAEGGTVTVGACLEGDRVRFSVRNPGVIPPRIQSMIFQRSFSTKAESGRGIGTHSVRLLTERYLGGKAWFVSAEPDGTEFLVELPLQFEAAASDGSE